MVQLNKEETEDVKNPFSEQSLAYKRGIDDILELASNILAETSKKMQDKIDNMSNTNDDK